MHTTGRRPRIASPAAKVTACCSAMPTSKKRSGKRCANSSRPVDDAIAAVIATIRSSASAASQSASPKTSVQSIPFLRAVPLSGSNVDTPWNLSTLSATAGPYPCPLLVTTCTTTGPRMRAASRSAFSTAARSWPSIGPPYLRPSVSKSRDRRDQLLERVLHAPGGLVRGVPHRGQRAQRGSGCVLGRLVAR